MMDTIWILRHVKRALKTVRNVLDQMLVSNARQDMKSTMLIVWHALLEHFIMHKLCILIDYLTKLKRM